MSKSRLRKIVIEGQIYLWKFAPSYEKDETGQWRCHDIFAAYTPGNGRNSLRVHFITWESPIDAGPLHTGARLLLGDPTTGGINLHQPKFAAQIIRQGLVRGWNPFGSESLVIEDGLTLLTEIV